MTWVKMVKRESVIEENFDKHIRIETGSPYPGNKKKLYVDKKMNTLNA